MVQTFLLISPPLKRGKKKKVKLVTMQWGKKLKCFVEEATAKLLIQFDMK